MAKKQHWRRVKQIFFYVEKDVWDQSARAPNIVRVGDKLRMYYHGQQGQFRRIGLAEADVSDPFTWRKKSDGPLLDLGEPGAIDSHWVAYPWVVPITDTHWHMYYGAWGGEFHMPGRKIWYTTMAESDDGGLTWTRTGHPLIELGRPFHGTGSCAVIKVEEEFWMYYTAVYMPRTDFYRISIALAVSTDGGHTFEPHPAGALLDIPPRIGDPGSTCSKPFLDHDDNIFRMWFSCAKDGRHYRIHYAESPDGIHFKWYPNPVLDVSASGWDSVMTAYPFILRLGERTLMYYNAETPGGLGVAELVSD